MALAFCYLVKLDRDREFLFVELNDEIESEKRDSIARNSLSYLVSPVLRERIDRRTLT